MRNGLVLVVMVVLLSSSAVGRAAEVHRNASRGIDAWQDLPGVNGKPLSLADLKDKEVVVVAITCNHCPLANEYFGRLKDFVDRHAAPDSKVTLVAISISNEETDRLPRMKELAERHGFNFPYLHDASQDVGRQLQATKTPEFFVLDRSRAVVYRGAWDDDMNPTKVSRRYVEDAVSALLAGKAPPVAETKAIGCMIRYDR